MHLSSVYTHIPVNPPYSVGYIPLVNHQQRLSYGAFHTVYYGNCSVFMAALCEWAQCVHARVGTYVSLCVNAFVCSKFEQDLRLCLHKFP